MTHQAKHRLFLLGKSLSHSFSENYFNQKFNSSPSLKNWSYKNYEVSKIENVRSLLGVEELLGFNVTIPYKEDIIPLLDEVEDTALKIGAVNTVVKEQGRFIGYNTDMPAFAESLTGFQFKKALVLGTGGASKAVIFALNSLGVDTLNIGRYTRVNYQNLPISDLAERQLIVNCTPLGTFPKTNEMPILPYRAIDSEHVLYDLTYNPTETAFLKEGKQRGAQIKNGLEMLEMQAELSFYLWNKQLK